MTQRIVAIFMLMLLTLGAGRALAHENFRVIGTLMKHQDATIEVKSREGKTTTVRLDKQTVITDDREKKKVDVSALRVGLSLVVNAYGDGEDDLLALDIRIVPPIGTRR